MSPLSISDDATCFSRYNFRAPDMCHNPALHLFRACAPTKRAHDYSEMMRKTTKNKKQDIREMRTFQYTTHIETLSISKRAKREK